MKKILNDRLAFSDNKSDRIKMPAVQSHGLWTRTEIIGSYDDIEYDKNGVFSRFVKKIPTGVSKLGETLFRTETVEPNFSVSNMVPIGGCQFAMEMLFGVNGTINVPTLYENTQNPDTAQAGIENSTSTVSKYDTPSGEQKSVIYDPGMFVQLFGIGITGAAENDVTIHNVDYRENSIDISRPTADNSATLTGTMIPFRYTTENLSDADKLMYFGKKTDGSTGVTSYYLKKFKSNPVINHIWKTGENIENEDDVTSENMWINDNYANIIESFTEITLVITKEDVKEWFIAQGQEDRARINTIALFTGQYVKAEDGSIGDYRDVRMFSKLIIPVEYLSLTKDLTLVYRVYTA